MADKTIPELSAATTPVSGADVLPISQSGGDAVKVSIANLTSGRSVDGTSFVVTGSTVPANGIYLPGTNTVGISTNTTLRLSVSTTAVTSTLPISNALGDATAPAYSFTGDLNTGIYSAGADTFNVACAGLQALQLSNGASAVGLDVFLSSSAVRFQPTTGTNIAITTRTRGTGVLDFYSHTGAVQTFQINTVASGVNHVETTPGTTGNPAKLSVVGSDTNPDLYLEMQGTGVLRYGTHSAVAAETVTGYITIKDAAGNTRKLAVIS